MNTKNSGYNNTQNKKIAKNTLVLYVRMIITLAINLYSSRLVLNLLGVEDYGIYNVVGGVVSVFAVLNVSMTTTVQRFLNYEIGKKNTKKLSDVFQVSIWIHLLIAIVSFVFSEIIGLWFLNEKMNIPYYRLDAANLVMQYSILSSIVMIIFVPYGAVLIANEDMKAYAYISVFESIGKVVMILLLEYMRGDVLVQYALFMFVVVIIFNFIKCAYVIYHFNEARFKLYFDSSVFKEMFSFAGWNLIGVSSTLAKTQGINIVLNLFFGPTVNAARGIANQVNMSIELFVTNFIMAIKPQITKSYARGDNDYVVDIIFNGTRYAYYLLLILCLPIYFQTDVILKLWLYVVPDYTIVFVKLILIFSLIESLSKMPIQAMFATGNIRNYQIVVGCITLLNVPISIFFLKNGYSPEIALYVAIVISFISLFVRLFMLKRLIYFSFKIYIKKVLMSIVSVTLISLFILHYFLFIISVENVFFALIIKSFTSVFVVLIVVYFAGLSKEERVVTRKYILKYM